MAKHTYIKPRKWKRASPQRCTQWFGFLLSFPMKSTVSLLLPKPPQPQELILFLQREITHHWQGTPAACPPGAPTFRPGLQESEEAASFKSSPHGLPQGPCCHCPPDLHPSLSLPPSSQGAAPFTGPPGHLGSSGGWRTAWRGGENSTEASSEHGKS